MRGDTDERERKSGRHQQQQQHTPCPGCVRNEKYLEMTAIWEKYSRHKERKINPLAFNKTHLKWANSSPLSLYPPPLDLLLALYHFPIPLDKAGVI